MKCLRNSSRWSLAVIVMGLASMPSAMFAQQGGGPRKPIYVFGNPKTGQIPIKPVQYRTIQVPIPQQQRSQYQPVIFQPAPKQPVQKQSVQKQSVQKQSVQKQSVPNQLGPQQPVPKQLRPKQPAQKHPAQKHPAQKHPAQKQPAQKHPAQKQPAQKQSIPQPKTQQQIPQKTPIAPMRPNPPIPGQQPPTSAGNPQARDKSSLGEKPKESNASVQFLRQDSILLDPGQYQFDISLQYLINESDFAFAQQVGPNLQVGEVRRRQRLLLLPIEYRLGITHNVQGFVNVPFGWSNRETVFAGSDEFSNTVGIGDVSAGLTKLMFDGTVVTPQIPFQVLGSLSFTAPTGESSFAASLTTPGSNLGQGFWTTTAGITAIHTFDPLVVFSGIGYTHRFQNTIDGFEVDPGSQVFYRFGVGFAVNSKVTLSASFLGSFIGENKVNDVSVAGSMQEPMLLRFAATFVRGPQTPACKSVQTIEPFVNLGLTEDAVDVLFGISRTF